MKKVARIVDDYKDPRFLAWDNKRVPVAYHVIIASSAGRKGRLLTTAMSFLKPKVVVEVGTAYGISSLFMGLALRAIGYTDAQPTIRTLEAYEPQASLCREMLGHELGEMVRCYHGTAQQTLPTMLKDCGPADFVFHDAGHSYDDYVNDFNLLEPHIAKGGILILDDIDWEDPRLTTPTRTYEGWQQVIAHPRVTRAAELDGVIGVAMFG